MANVQDPEVPLVLIGALNSNGREAVIILKDNVTTSKDTVCICQRIIELDLSIYNLIVFKSDKVKGCTRFSTDISGALETTCLMMQFIQPLT